MKKKLLLFIVVLASVYSLAQTPLWQGKGRIAFSSDGNEHDDDDWAATAMTLALLDASGLKDNLALYVYSDHIWGSNRGHPKSKNKMCAYDQMRESAVVGAEMFNIDKSKLICGVDDPEAAYNAMAKVINDSSESNPILIIAAGPMQVVGEAIARADKAKRKFVTVVSHSKWNDEHGDKHDAWTWNKMVKNFAGTEGGSVNFVHIKDQNGGGKNYKLQAPVEMFSWVKTSPARDSDFYKTGSWDWLYTRLQSCERKAKNDHPALFDVSDSGMLVYVLTGNENGKPESLKLILENPKKK